LNFGLLCFYLFTDKPKKDRKQNILAITDHGHGNKSVTTTAVSVSTLMTSTPSTSTATMQDSTNVTQMPSLQLSSDSEYMEISSIESGKFSPALCITNLAIAVCMHNIVKL